MTLLLMLSLISSERTYGDVTRGVEVVAVYDGDTFTANVKGWPPIIGERVQIRLRGIDAPELTSKDPAKLDQARLAKRRLVELLRGTPDHRPRVTLHAVARDKYFRVLATVRADGVDVGQVLVSEGLARPYDGGPRQ